MFTREQLEELINQIREKIGVDSSALVSEDLLSMISNYQLALEEIEALRSAKDELAKTNEELLKVNGKLFQKIGFEKEEEIKEEEIKNDDEAEELTVEDVIDERGELI